MISSNEIRNRQISAAQGGYNKDEVNILLDEAADTVDAYAAESKELYRKMEILAAKIEEYRVDEDSIKTAIISAQKMADTIEQQAKDKAAKSEHDSSAKAAAIVEEATKKAEEILTGANARYKEKLSQAEKKANEMLSDIKERDISSKENAQKLITETRAYCKNLIAENTEKAAQIISDAEEKANKAISSSKIVAQNVLDQAKEISEELLVKSKEEKEAYELLVSALKNDAKEFIEHLKSLYSSQLDVLNSAKLESENNEADKPMDEVDSIHSNIENLMSEMSEIEDSIPDAVTIEKTEEPVEIIDTQEAPSVEEYVDISSGDDEFTDMAFAAETEENKNDSYEQDDDVPDPMEAVEAFSQNEITPVDTSSSVIPEIHEKAELQEAEKSLFDEDSQQPFESYFNVKRDDPHLDRTQTISLIPPEDEDEEDDDEPRFKGFFKKKK